MRLTMKKTYSIFYLFVTILTFTYYGCSDDDEANSSDCDASGNTANIQMRKTNVKCSDIDLPWDISFGVKIEFEFFAHCGENCSEGQMFYNRKQILKNAGGIKDIKMGRIYKSCNDTSIISYTFNDEIQMPDSMHYELGDTMVFEYFDPGLCAESGFPNCGEETELNLPDFTFIYVLTPEDFECD